MRRGLPAKLRKWMRYYGHVCDIYLHVVVVVVVFCFCVCVCFFFFATCDLAHDVETIILYFHLH